MIFYFTGKAADHSAAGLALNTNTPQVTKFGCWSSVFISFILNLPMTTALQTTRSYNIIAYPLDAIIITPKLYFAGHDTNGQHWSYDSGDAIVYPDYMTAFTDLMKIKRKNQIFLILIHYEHKTN